MRSKSSVYKGPLFTAPKRLAVLIGLYILSAATYCTAANCIDIAQWAEGLQYDAESNRFIDPRRPTGHAYRMHSITYQGSREDGTVCHTFYTESGNQCDWVFVRVDIQFKRMWVPWNSFSNQRFTRDITTPEGLKAITCGLNNG